MMQVSRTAPPVAPAGGEEIDFALGPLEAVQLVDAAVRAYVAGRYGEALQAYDGAYAMSPMPELRYRQAACLDQLGLSALAAQRYEAYLAEAPDAPDAEAVRHQVTTLHERARESAHAAAERGHAAGARGHWREAAWAYAQAYEEHPLPQYLDQQGTALEQAGDRAGAVRCLQRGLDTHPGATEAPQWRERIDALEQALRPR
jgi:tetratricopeptide (TPR) repeat protein